MMLCLSWLYQWFKTPVAWEINLNYKQGAQHLPASPFNATWPIAVFYPRVIEVFFPVKMDRHHIPRTGGQHV